MKRYFSFGLLIGLFFSLTFMALPSQSYADFNKLDNFTSSTMSSVESMIDNVQFIDNQDSVTSTQDLVISPAMYLKVFAGLILLAILSKKHRD